MNPRPLGYEPNELPDCYYPALMMKKDCKEVAGVKGFEPLNAWTKTRCLTAWRYPNKMRRNYNEFARLCQVASPHRICTNASKQALKNAHLKRKSKDKVNLSKHKFITNDNFYFLFA